MHGHFHARHIEFYNRAMETLCRDCGDQPPPDAEACPDATVIKPDVKKCAATGREVRMRRQNLTPLVEPLSIDEAFMDLADAKSLTDELWDVVVGPQECSVAEQEQGSAPQLCPSRAVGYDCKSAVAHRATSSYLRAEANRDCTHTAPVEGENACRLRFSV